MKKSNCKDLCVEPNQHYQQHNKIVFKKGCKSKERACCGKTKIDPVYTSPHDTSPLLSLPPFMNNQQVTTGVARLHGGENRFLVVSLHVHNLYALLDIVCISVSNSKLYTLISYNIYTYFFEGFITHTFLCL